jgi:hypothetical protein
LAPKSIDVSSGLRLAAQGISDDWELASEHQLGLGVAAFTNRKTPLDSARIDALAAGLSQARIERSPSGKS